MLAHLGFGAWGTSRLARAAGADGFSSFLAAALFLHAPFTRLFAYELPLEAMAISFLPWTMLLMLRQGQGADWRVCGIAAGLLWGAVPWCGGYIVLLYGFLAFGLMALVLAVLSTPPDRTRVGALLRAGGMLTLLTLVFAAVAAGRILPTAAWAALTDRAEALPYETTLAGVLLAREFFADLLSEGWAVVGLAAFATAVALVRRRLHALAFVAVLGLVAVLTLGLVHRFVYDYVPGFDKVRDPRRAWVLLPGVLPVLAALGLKSVRSALSRTRLAPLVTPGPLAAVVALALLATLGFDNSRSWRRPEIISLSERIEANELHRELARRAEDERLFRVLDRKDTRPKLKRTADLVRAGYDLQSVEGVIGNILVDAYDYGFVQPGQLIGPRVWGMMNCRYVTSMEPLDERFLQHEGTFAEDPNELSKGTDGPYLYRNRAELPRAYLADAAVVLLDPVKPQSIAMLASDAWSPRRAVLARSTSVELLEADDALLSHFASFVACEENARAVKLRDRVRALGGRWRVHPPEGVATPPGWLLAEEPERLLRLEDPVYGWRGARVDVGGDSPAGLAAPKWLVLAETYAIYPGWRAEVDGATVPLFRANGAATAIPLPAGAREVVLSYFPEDLGLGLAISAAGVATALAALWRLRAARRLPGDSVPAAT
ncbi:MAG: YfhO family protein [Planctomycetota bacterium]